MAKELILKYTDNDYDAKSDDYGDCHNRLQITIGMNENYYQVPSITFKLKPEDFSEQ